MRIKVLLELLDCEVELLHFANLEAMDPNDYDMYILAHGIPMALACDLKQASAPVMSRYWRPRLNKGKYLQASPSSISCLLKLRLFILFMKTKKSVRY